MRDELPGEMAGSGQRHDKEELLTANTARLRPAVAAMATLGLVMGLVFATPAAEAQTEGGAGVATGTEYPAAQVQASPNIPPTSLPVFCAQVARDSSLPNPDLLYTLTGEGTYTGLTQGSSAPAIYSTTLGATPLDIKVLANDNTFPYYIAPEGTYTDSNCEDVTSSQGLGNVPGANGIPVDVTVHAPGSIYEQGTATSSNPGGDPCPGTGQFRRVNTTFVLDWDLDQPCTVVGNVPQFTGTSTAPGSDPGGTTHTFVGHLTPCLQDPSGTIGTCGAPASTAPQLAGSYQQTLHGGSPVP